MTENKRFTFKNWNDYAEGDCIYYDDDEEMGSLDVLDTLNELHEENQELQYKLLAILDFINEKETVTHQEMKDFWNEMVIDNE